MPPPSPDPLFRREAVKARQAQIFGGVVQMPPVWSAGVAWLSLLLAAALVVLLAFGSYTRRSTVTGQIYPQEGLIRIAADQAGVVAQANVREGQAVQRGAVLFVLSSDRQGPDAMDFQRGIAAQIAARQRLLEGDLERISQTQHKEADQLARRLESLRAEQARILQQSRQQRLRVATAADTVARYEALFRQGYVSRDELSARQADLAQLRGQEEGIRREALTLQRELDTVRLDADNLPTRFTSQRGEIERAILLARQEFTEIEARRRIVVSAPTDGIVTLLRAEAGQHIEPARTLAHLMPAGSRLVARLYVPGRAAGFIRPSMPVMLRHEAFPYQKFGQQAGRVVAVSSAAVPAAELDDAAIRPDAATDRLFAVTVELTAPPVTTTGHRLPLQVGMKVEADLLHENRRLYEWMLEPLLAARARI